jgi:magnesium chelatase subunit D
MIATFNPEEQELRPHFVDRVGIVLSADSKPLTLEQRTEAVNAVIG